jgi:hypothetical protein
MTSRTFQFSSRYGEVLLEIANDALCQSRLKSEFPLPDRDDFIIRNDLSLEMPASLYQDTFAITLQARFLYQSHSDIQLYQDLYFIIPIHNASILENTYPCNVDIFNHVNAKDIIILSTAVVNCTLGYELSRMWKGHLQYLPLFQNEDKDSTNSKSQVYVVVHSPDTSNTFLKIIQEEMQGFKWF